LRAGNSVNCPLTRTLSLGLSTSVQELSMGRKGSKYGMDDYLEIKYRLMGGI